MLSFLITIIKVIVLLGFLIFIHEGGHFLVEKLCKVTVNEFAIGFGPTIWKSKNTKTKYFLVRTRTKTKTLFSLSIIITKLPVFSVHFGS